MDASKITEYVWTGLRLGMGWIFFWAFIDKLFGLGFATAPENAWLAGGSPTTGFLQNAVQGPLASVFQALAGNPIADWLFMLALLVTGVTMLLGIFRKWGGIVGAVLMTMIYFALLFPANNPILDDHIIYALVLLGLAFSKQGQTLSLGKMLSRN